MTETTTTAARRGDGRVAFLANKDPMQIKLDAGHSLRSIYDEFEARLGISYPQFTRYVKQFLRQKEATDGHQTRGRAGDAASLPLPFPTSEQQAEAPAAGDAPAAERTGSKPAFSHDPNSGNTRDDLV